MRQDDHLSLGSLVRKWFRELRGVVIGALTALPNLVAVGSGAVRMTEFELRRIARYGPAVPADPLTPARCRRYLGMRWLVGVLGAGVVVLLLQYLLVALTMVTAWISGGAWGLIEDDDQVGTGLILMATPIGILLIFMALAGITGVATLDRWLATRVLGTDPHTLLRRRVAELTSTRADVIEAIDDERRRIERDLHDGVQQRLVALGMLIGRARRSSDVDRMQELLIQAHSTTSDAITDLREVASRVYPAVLDEAGLRAALESLAEGAGVRVRLRFDLTTSPGTALETVIYFVVSEAVNNAAKHAAPTLVEVTVTQQDGHVVARVHDDGSGGANPTGSGLTGLARRVAAVDGTFAVDSPPGGPTVVEARVPCG